MPVTLAEKSGQAPWGVHPKLWGLEIAVRTLPQTRVELTLSHCRPMLGASIQHSQMSHSHLSLLGIDLSLATAQVDFVAHFVEAELGGLSLEGGEGVLTGEA